MNLFNSVINNGLDNFIWVATHLIGDHEAIELREFNSYVESLTFKLKHNKKEDIVLELKHDNTIIGDEDNFIEIQNYLSNLFV